MPVLRFFRIEPKGVHQAALLLALSSLANGALGLLRDRLLAGTYGASRMLDIYYAAFRVPDFIFSLSLFFVASTAFIPLFMERQDRSGKDAEGFFNSLLSIFFLSLAALALGAYFLMPFILKALAPGFDDASQSQTLLLSRLMLFSPLFLGISSLVSGVLQSSKKFLAYGLSPIVYNLGIIVGVIWLYPLFGLQGLAFGVLLGALLHLAVQLPTFFSLGMNFRFRFSREAEPLRILSYSFPRAMAMSWNQLTFFALTSLASTLGAGAISVFNLSYNLQALPLTVIGLSYSIAAFPTMAELVLKKERSLFFEHLLSATRHIFFWTVPIAGLCIVLRAHIVRLILGTGAFAWGGTRLTAASLLLFAFAIIFQSLVTLFVRAYYALGRTHEPVVYNIFASLVTVGIAFFAVIILEAHTGLRLAIGRAFRIEDLANIEFLSLPLAYVLGSLVNALLLGIKIFRLNGGAELKSLKSSTRNITLVSIVISSVTYLSLKILSALGLFRLDTFLSVFLHAGISGLLGVLVGVFIMERAKIPEFLEIKEAVFSRFVKKEILQPETEHM